MESNAHRYLDRSTEPYLATEFIDGDELAKLVQGDLAAQRARGVVIDLCEIVDQAHSLGVVHRDIKPDNIIIVQNGDSLVPYLVDFGLSYIDTSESEFETSSGHELGNRFLRLPEHSIGSSNQRDPRSDITQCVGILFYMLTGKKPAVLDDDSGRKPHQRHFPRVALSASGFDQHQLLSIFDRGFATNIDARFQSVAELVTELVALQLLDEAPQTGNPADTLSRLRARLADPERDQLRRSSDNLQALVESSRALARKVTSELDAGISVSIGAYKKTSDGASFSLSFTDAVQSKTILEVDVSIAISGIEVVMSHRASNAMTSAVPFQQGTLGQIGSPELIEQFLIRALDEAFSEEKYLVPRELETSPYHLAGHQDPGDVLPEEEATWELRPVFKIDWYPPRQHSDRVELHWTIVNIGAGNGMRTALFVPGIVACELGDLAPGGRKELSCRFETRTAYFDFTKPPVQAIIEASDIRGNIYRQSSGVIAFPNYGQIPADNVTTQFGYPYLVRQRIVEPDTGRDRFQQSGGRNFFPQ